MNRRQILLGGSALFATLGAGTVASARKVTLEPSQIRGLTPGLSLDHPEGVTTGPDGNLYAGGVGGQVYRITPQGGVTEIARTGGVSLGMAVDGDGAVYVCDPIQRVVVRVTPEGKASIYCKTAGGQPLVLPNDCAFGPDGALWVSDSGKENPAVPTGRLLRVPVGGGDAEIQPLEPLHFANGLCVDGEGTVFILESFRRRLSAYRRKRLVTVGTTPGFSPDGVTLDRTGGFVITAYYPFGLLTMTSRGGKAETLFDDKWGITLKMPANASYFGEGLRELAVSNLGGFGLSALTPPVAGAPLHYPKGIGAAIAATSGKA